MSGEVRDGISLAKNITGLRLKNAIRTYRGYRKALRSRSPIHPAYPISLSVEPTTSCNLRCPECPSGLRSFTRPTGMLDQATFRTIVDELHSHLMYLILYFQGEPFLNPHFLEMVRYAESKKIYTATSTNAHYLSKEAAMNVVSSGLKRIIISMDGIDQETYERYRVGGKLANVLEGIENLVNTKKALKRHHPHIILQFLLFEHNIHQVPAVRQLAARLEVDRLELKTAQVYNFENGSGMIPSEEKYSRYRRDQNGTYRIKSQNLNKCWKMWHSCVMTWDGDIVPCCFDKDGKYTMGNIQQESFQDIWNGDKYLDFRARLFSDRTSIDICRNCTEGLKI